MAGSERWHSKFHGKNHHTSPTPGIPDSAADPIASPTNPFQGDFYLKGSLSASGAIFGTFIGPTFIPVATAAGNYNAKTTDKVLVVSGGLVIMPPASSVSGQEYFIKSMTNSFSVTISAQGRDVFDGTYTSFIIESINAPVHLVSVNSSWWILTTY